MYLRGVHNCVETISCTARSNSGCVGHARRSVGLQCRRLRRSATMQGQPKRSVFKRGQKAELFEDGSGADERAELQGKLDELHSVWSTQRTGCAPPQLLAAGAAAIPTARASRASQA